VTPFALVLGIFLLGLHQIIYSSTACAFSIHVQALVKVRVDVYARYLFAAKSGKVFFIN